MKIYKIYNRRNFAFGVLCLVLAVANLFACLGTGWDVSGVVLVVLLVVFGVISLGRSFSRRLSREDKLEKMDERNQLLELKTKCGAFRWTQGICFALMLVLLVAGKVSGENTLIAVGVGMAFAWAVSMFAEIAAAMYYESKM